MTDFVEVFENLLQLGPPDVKRYSPIALAYLGDSVYDVLVKYYLVTKGNKQAHKYHVEATSYVKASQQARIFRLIEDQLTEEEYTVFKRGRNAKSHSKPKHADLMDYKVATGFEALLGYLFLKGEKERVASLVARGINQ